MAGIHSFGGSRQRARTSEKAGEKTADGADESNGDVVVATGAVSPSPDAVVVAGAS
jgi:hypothetical protein